MTKEHAEVLRRVEDELHLDSSTNTIFVSYPWTEKVHQMRSNKGQARSRQAAVEARVRAAGRHEDYKKECWV